MKTKTLKLLAIPVLLATSTIGYAVNSDVGYPLDIPLSVLHGTAHTDATFENTFSNITNEFDDNSYGVDQTIAGNASVHVSSTSENLNLSMCGISFRAKNHDKVDIDTFDLTSPSDSSTISYTVNSSGTRTSNTPSLIPWSLSPSAPGLGMMGWFVNGECSFDITKLQIRLAQPSFTPKLGTTHSGMLVLKASYF